MLSSLVLLLRSAARTDRLVLLDLFTGSECPPCVAADLALDGVIARYPPTPR